MLKTLKHDVVFKLAFFIFALAVISITFSYKNVIDLVYLFALVILAVRFLAEKIKN